MTIAEIESELPNGFHDAKLIAMHRNLIEEIMVLEIEVLVGLPDDEVDNRDRVRKAILKFNETKIVVVERPDVESSFQFPRAVSIDITEDEPGAFPIELTGKIPNKHHTYTIFVQDWLSNILIAASDVEFEWSDEESKL